MLLRCFSLEINFELRLSSLGLRCDATEKWLGNPELKEAAAVVVIVVLVVVVVVVEVEVVVVVVVVVDVLIATAADVAAVDTINSSFSFSLLPACQVYDNLFAIYSCL